jgi:hypothetical protein
MAELLPCPFCGGESYIDLNECGSWIVRCKKCPIDFGRFWYSRKQDIKKAWNRRTPKERGEGDG